MPYFAKPLTLLQAHTHTHQPTYVHNVYAIFFCFKCSRLRSRSWMGFCLLLLKFCYDLVSHEYCFVDEFIIHVWK